MNLIHTSIIHTAFAGARSKIGDKLHFGHIQLTQFFLNTFLEIVCRLLPRFCQGLSPLLRILSSLIQFLLQLLDGVVRILNLFQFPFALFKIV